MTPELTLQEKADYLAAHLLGWHREDSSDVWGKNNWRWADKEGTFRGYTADSVSPMCAPDFAWTPQDDISQCFAHIIPAMEKRGIRLELLETFIDDIPTWDAYFYPEEADGGGYGGADTPEAAIVEAAYAAIKEKERKRTNFKMQFGLPFFLVGVF